MALIVIKVRDGAEEGKVDVSLETEPPFDLTDEGTNTPAQYLALTMLQAAAAGEEGE